MNEIPKPIAGAVLSLVNPYFPNLTETDLQDRLAFRPEETFPCETARTRKEAARDLNVSVCTVDRMLREGQLTRLRIRGSVRIPQSAILKILGGAVA